MEYRLPLCEWSSMESLFCPGDGSRAVTPPTSCGKPPTSYSSTMATEKGKWMSLNKDKGEPTGENSANVMKHLGENKYRVRVPDGLRGGDVFNATINGRDLKVRVPPKARGVSCRSLTAAPVKECCSHAPRERRFECSSRTNRKLMRTRRSSFRSPRGILVPTTPLCLLLSETRKLVSFAWHARVLNCVSASRRKLMLEIESGSCWEILSPTRWKGAPERRLPRQ